MDAKISGAFWSDPDIEEQPQEVKLTMLWLLTNPDRDLCGVTRLSVRRFAFQTGLEPEWIDTTIGALSKSLVREGERVLALNFIGYQIGEGRALAANNWAKGLTKPFGLLPERLQLAILERYPELKPLLSPCQGVAPVAKPSKNERNGGSEETGGSKEGSLSPKGLPSPSTEQREKYREEQGGAGGPTVEEVIERGKEAAWALSEEECRKFHRHYAGVGWMHGGAKIVQWWEWMPKWKEKAKTLAAKKPAAGAASGVSAELETIRARLEWETDLEKIAELKKREGELQ